MSGSDYFSYKAQKSPSTQSTQSTESSKLGSQYKLNSNVAFQSQNKGYSNPVSPTSKGLSASNYTNSTTSMNYFMAPTQNNINPIRSIKRQPSKSIYQHSTNTSNSSSAHSSRRPSVGNLGNLTTMNKLSSSNKINMNSEMTNNISTKRNSITHSSPDSNVSTPTLVLPPDLASLTTKKSSNMLNSPQQSNVIHKSSSFQEPGANIHTTLGTPPQEGISSNSSTRSVNLAQSSSVNLRSFKKQYVLNEKLYLDKMKNSLHGDDYYTRRIGLSSSLNDNDYYDDFDIDFDDPFSEHGGSTSNINDEDMEFAATFSNSNTVNTNENLVAISPRYLLHQLQWVKKTYPDEKALISLINKIQKKEYKYMMKQKRIFDNDIIEISNEMNLLDTENRLKLYEKSYFEELLNYPVISERKNWQTMLINVLKGDIVLSEKSKLAEQVKNPASKKQLNDDIWYELKGWMNGKRKEDLIKTVKILRNSSDEVFEEILNFKIDDEMIQDADGIEKALVYITEKYCKTINYWPNMKQLRTDKPITRSETFVNRIDSFNSWLNVKQSFDIILRNFKEWVGNDELDVVKQSTTPLNTSSSSSSSLYEHSSRSFAEQVMKEKDIEDIFEKKIFSPLAPWIAKAKSVLLEYHEIFDIVKLKFDESVFTDLLLFPMKLIKEIIITRLAYAKRLKNPTMMTVDQMIEDFSSYIRLSVQLKCSLLQYCDGIPLHIDLEPKFDNTVLEAISYLFTLLHLKVLDTSKKNFKTVKEPEVLFKYWEELKNVGIYIDNAGKLIANEFNKLTLRILHKILAYLVQQQDSPPKFKNSAEAEKWLVEVFENLGSMKRKLNRFTNVLTRAFQNSAHYEINDSKELLKELKDSGHFLIYTGGSLEDNGVYLVGSAELLGCQDSEIMRILNNSDIGSDLIPSIEINNSLSAYNRFEGYSDQDANLQLENAIYNSQHYDNFRTSSRMMPIATNNNDTGNDISGLQPNYATSFDYNDTEREILYLESKLQSLGYILVLCPGHPMLWEGDMYTLFDETPLQFEKFKLKLQVNKLALLNQGSSYALEYQTDSFQQIAEYTVSFIERRCSFNSIERNLQRINKAYFKLTYNVLNNYPKLYDTVRDTCPNVEMINNLFLFTRDFGSNFLKINVANMEKKSVIILLMIKLAVKWLLFIIDECDPTDQKTFRWCVSAMEFAMHMTSGHNIIALDETQFTALKQKIAACMSLLISHFDVMGARAVEAEITGPKQRINIGIHEDFDSASTLKLNSDLRLRAIGELEVLTRKNPRQIGKVLDDTDKGNKYLLSLASSLSNVSIRWQKRDFVGGGTFGKVYSAVNLDNGDILAVKEIRIQDSKTMKKIFPSIKEEMEVLEMLSHPNIVQYYGVEVHRQKVNIFMEYCEGGSLASLLEHGRIEDEMVTQVYTLELLEGLAYLHQSGVVHRDIKPENILLDFNGVIKYVDFGAAKKIARNGTIMGHLSINTANKASDSSNHKRGQEKPKEEIPGGLQEMMGTPMYMAPESITGSLNKGKFGADDVWSLGCVVLEMITGRRPWSNLDNEWAIMYQVAAGHIPQLPANNEVSTAGRHFLTKSLVQNPSKRATAVELLMDPWIVEIRELAFGPTEDLQSVSTPLLESEPNSQPTEHTQ